MCPRMHGCKHGLADVGWDPVSQSKAEAKTGGGGSGGILGFPFCPSYQRQGLGGCLPHHTTPHSTSPPPPLPPAPWQCPCLPTGLQAPFPQHIFQIKLLLSVMRPEPAEPNRPVDPGAPAATHWQRSAAARPDANRWNAFHVPAPGPGRPGARGGGGCWGPIWDHLTQGAFHPSRSTGLQA